MSRDPRVDPRPGDVLTKNSLSRRVVRTYAGNIYWRRDGAESAIRCAWISTWMEWARTATILHTAEVPDAE